MNEATRIRPAANVELGASSEEFQNLHEFVRKARANLNQNAWDYIVGAAETETTMRRNRMALDEIAFRPRVLRNVAKVDASVELFGRKLRLPVVLAPVGALEIFDPGSRRQRGARRGHVRRRPYAELGFRARPGEGRAGRARRAADVSALCPRRRRLCRGLRQPRDRQRLYRLLPDRRHRALQPPRTRYRQALRPREPAARHRRRLPEGAGVAHRQTDQGQVQDSRWSSRGSPPRKTRRSRSITASTGSTCRTTADASSITAAARCMCCPRSSAPSPAARRSWSTARSAAAPTSSRRSPWAPISSASAACNAGRSPPAAKPESCGCWSCSKTR